MIKELTKNFLVFVGLVLAISSFNGCSGNAGNGVNTGNTLSNVNSNANTGSTASTGDYPPLLSSVANAEFENLDGTKFKPVDKKGKIVLMNLWGIWCGPCRAEMPELVKLQDQYRDKDFEIIGLNIGKDQDTDEPESVDAIKQFAAKMGLNYTLARSPRESSNKFYEVSGKSVVPQSILIDKQGRLRGVFTGFGPNITQSMRDTLAKLVSEQ
jgi:thiol-disulfide isomerase/thioredoxin